ncbi:MAG: hypothetical protein JXA33_01225 [Anaerolineae bacterium]|nr:hypothetical protein [Anaerolineae bacterium]
MVIPALMIGLLIAKGLTVVGPKHEYLEKHDPNLPFYEEDTFPTLLEKIAPYTHSRFQLHINRSADLFAQLHTMLMLLQGATMDFAKGRIDHSNMQPGYQYDNYETILVNAYSNEEDKKIIDGKLNAISKVSDESFGEYIIDHYQDMAKCLVGYLDIASKLTNGFDISGCLNECQNTIGKLPPGDSIKKTCMTEFLALTRLLFSGVDLKKVLDLATNLNLNVPPHEWLDQQLSAGTLWQDVVNYYASPAATSKAKLTLSHIYVMLEESYWFYNRIRYKDPHNPEMSNNRLGIDFKCAIGFDDEGKCDNLNTGQLPAGYQATWEKLRLALHGAVAWYMYCLCAYAVNEIKAALTP